MQATYTHVGTKPGGSHCGYLNTQDRQHSLQRKSLPDLVHSVYLCRKCKSLGAKDFASKACGGYDKGGTHDAQAVSPHRGRVCAHVLAPDRRHNACPRNDSRQKVAQRGLHPVRM